MINKNKALEMRENGKTLQEIADYFGVSRQRIHQKIGNTVDLRNKNIKNKIIELRNSKHTVKEIHDITGVSHIFMKKMAGNKWLKSCRDPVPDGFKRCYKCKRNIPKDKFYGNSTRCIECTKQLMSDYFQKNKKKIRNYYFNQDKDKTNARQAVRFAIKKGIITKGFCKINDQHCRGRVEAHHYLGYKKEHRLDIEWYCAYHHRHIDGLTWGKRKLVLAKGDSGVYNTP